MKKKLLRIFLFFTLLIGLIVPSELNGPRRKVEAQNIKTGQYVFLEPNTWSSDSPWYACYFFNGSKNAWVKGVSYEGNKIYSFTVPSGEWTNFIFTRMNPSNNNLSWDAKWNQTNNLSYDGSKNLWKITGWNETNYETYTISKTITLTAETGGTVSGAGTFAVNKTTTIKATANTGYKFTKWDDGNTNSERTITIGLKDLTYKAIFSAKTYTVTLDNQSATSSGTTSITATYNSAMPSINVPEKVGYTFNGYFTSNNVQYYNSNGTSVKNWDLDSDTTLYARWTINQYAVSVSAKPTEGGSVSHTDGTTSNATQYNYNSNITFTATPQTGYHFVGWAKSSSENTIVSTSETYSVTLGTEGISLIGKFAPNEYTLTLDPNGGNLLNTTKQITFNTKYGELPEPSHTDGENIFIGWYTEKENGTEVTANSIYTIANNSTIYAHWKKVPSHTISFDINGGNEDSLTHTNITAFETLKYSYKNDGLPKNPTREGYEFKGWNTKIDGSGTNITDSSTVPENSSDHTLYAQWSPNSYTITLSQRDSTTPGTKTSVPATYDDDMINISKAELPQRTGYTFSGYATEGGILYYNSDGSSARTWDIANNTTLYPVWEANNYTINFDSSKPINASTSVLEGTTSLEVTYDQKPNSITVPSLDGYKFNGYYTEKNGAGTKYFNSDGSYNGTRYNIDDNLQLYAYWTANNYNVTLNTNGGSYTNSYKPPLQHTFDTATTLPTADNISKVGFTFGGWYTNEDLSGEPVSEIPATTAENTSYYASWVPITYTITLDQDKATTTANTTTAEGTYSQNLSKLSDVPSRTGYLFDGYYTGKNGSGKKYYDSTGSGIGQWDITSDTTLYAHWTPISYTVNLYANTSSTDETFTTITVTYDQEFKLVNNDYTNGDYVIWEWSTNRNGTGTVYENNVSRAWNLVRENGGSIDLYAVWVEEPYYITYTNATDGQSGVTNSNITYYLPSSNYIYLSQPTREGYEFAGWKCEDLGVTNLTKNLAIPAGTAQDLEIVAYWNQYVTIYIDAKAVENCYAAGTHEVRYPFIHYWKIGGNDSGTFASCQMTKIGQLDYYKYIIYFTKENEPFKNSAGKVIDSFDCIQFGYDEYKVSDKSQKKQQTDPLYFASPINSSNHGQEYIFTIEGNQLDWGGWQPGKSYTLYGMTWTHNKSESDDSEKWYTYTYRENLGVTVASNQVEFIVDFGNWSGVKEVWINGTGGSKINNNELKWKVTITTTKEIDSIDMDFRRVEWEKSSWWHINNGYDLYDPNAKSSHNNISNLIIQTYTSPKVIYYDGNNIVKEVNLANAYNIQFVEKEGYKLEGWYLDQALTNKFTSNTIIEFVDNEFKVYANYVEANDYYIYIETKDLSWNKDTMSYYTWSSYFGDHNNSWPGSRDGLEYIGNGIYKLHIDASKSYDKLIFCDSSTPNETQNDKKDWIVQTENIDLNPKTSYYVITNDTYFNEDSSIGQDGRHLNPIFEEINLDNFLHAQKNNSSDVNDFRFIAGFTHEDKANAYGSDAQIFDSTTKQFGYKFIFIKGNTSYVGYWNFQEQHKYDVIRYEGTVYQSGDKSDYSEYYALSLTDSISFNYSDWDQIVVIACYRDQNNNVQVIKAQEYNIVGTPNNVSLYAIER